MHRCSQDAIRAAIRKAMPGIAARNGYNETQLNELKSQAKGSERVAIPKPITAEKFDTAMKSQRDWERRQREDNEVGAHKCTSTRFRVSHFLGSGQKFAGPEATHEAQSV
jgi:hypothetical protein